MKLRRPRSERARYQRLPLPLWVRVVVLTSGWLLVVIGVVGLFLPVLQGGLSLALGFALLSIGSQSAHLWLRKLLGRWPGLWKRLERLRRRMHRWIHRRTGGGDVDLEASTADADADGPTTKDREARDER